MFHQFSVGTPTNRDPSRFLQGIVVDLDPTLTRITLNTGVIEIFGGFTQGTAANRAAWTGADNQFGGKPVATFDGSNDQYTIGNLTSLTSAEAFVVMARAADPAATLASSGLYRIGSPGNGCHVPYTDGVIYETFATNLQRVCNNPAQSLAVPVLYNPWNATGDFSIRIQGASHFTSAAFGAPAFSGTALFGGTSSEFMSGRVARFILCDRKQSAEARRALELWVRRYYNVPVA